MNLEKLKRAEEDFFYRYPGGFDNPELIEIRKKHQLNKMFTTAEEAFAKSSFQLPGLIAENIIKVITRSSLISIFERARFREFARSLPPRGTDELSSALEELLHGNQKMGFET